MTLRLAICMFAFFLFNNCSDGMSRIDKISDKIIKQYTQEMKKKGLYAAGTGGGQKNGKINLVDVCFDIHEVMNMETARKLIVDAANELMRLVNLKKEDHVFYEKIPIPVDNLHLSIIGLVPKEYKNYIRIVSIIKGKIYYCTDDPLRKIMPFIEVHEETFEEAQEMIKAQENQL